MFNVIDFISNTKAVFIKQKQFSIDTLINFLFQQTSNFWGEQMPARKVKNNNKEKELMEKLEAIEKEENTTEQIDIEEEPTESKKRR